jgi:hypothetical protein
MDIAQTAPETLILAEDEASLYLQATTTAVWAARGQTPMVRVLIPVGRRPVFMARSICIWDKRSSPASPR